MSDAVSLEPLPLEPTSLAPLPPTTRLVLRAGPDAVAALAAAFGVPIPRAPLTSAAGPTAQLGAATGARAALWLGPDEWLLLAEPGAAAALAAVLEAAAAPVSVVDVSDGLAGLSVAGPAAALLLAEGCPLDLDPAAFPPGSSSRTLFGKVEILLWRPGPAEAFQLLAGRSFLPHLLAHLEAAAADLETAHG